jgi:hypothetical protein
MQKYNGKEIRQGREDCVSSTVMVCAPSWVVIGLSDEESKEEGTYDTLVTDLKSVQYDGGKKFMWKF